MGVVVPVYNIYSKRKKAAETAGQPDVYTYDKLPAFLRHQVAQIWDDAIGFYYRPHALSTGVDTENGNSAWDVVDRAMQREIANYGNTGTGKTSRDRCRGFLLGHDDIDEVLSIIELSCRMLADYRDRGITPNHVGGVEHAVDALAEINHRFREHGVGYQVENMEIIRIDSRYSHEELTKPALALVSAPLFQTANDDFMAAHRHYRHREYKDVTTAAQRAFESALKAICSDCKWTYPTGARASELVTVCRSNGLFPDYLDAGLTTYISMLKTGLPGVRNNAGGHGAAPTDPPVEEDLAAYALHMTAANIILAVERFNKRKKGK